MWKPHEMRQQQKSPAGRVTGRALECLADVHEYSTYSTDIKHLLRLSRLQRWHGLNGSRAVLIADLAFDGCSR